MPWPLVCKIDQCSLDAAGQTWLVLNRTAHRCIFNLIQMPFSLQVDFCHWSWWFRFIRN